MVSDNGVKTRDELNSMSDIEFSNERRRNQMAREGMEQAEGAITCAKRVLSLSQKRGTVHTISRVHTEYYDISQTEKYEFILASMNSY